MYNVLSGNDFQNVKRIRELGHSISIHFDPTIYMDFYDGLAMETKMFDVAFNEPVKIISLHRPNDFFLQFDSTILGVEHTYQNKYFRDIKYFADSTGAWRFGHPFDSEEF